jgi:hypothetical protein
VSNPEREDEIVLDSSFSQLAVLLLLLSFMGVGLFTFVHVHVRPWVQQRVHLGELEREVQRFLLSHVDLCRPKDYQWKRGFDEASRRYLLISMVMTFFMSLFALWQ